ncbi:subtilase-type protease inhibitor [Streptomyces sp. TRM76323]|uniref:Probable subtilase-type protease inhibitor n=1 Tax=Streptomyces tamarix TaxID=3078565 RepID=A0ABU3QI83_9ACTN|nr:subtilase-type protease inhibitor [Streptomyces tamarix]MDT9682454.1 subtilase-type protease inhibitor [Streptomyces tamarix]
MRHRIAAVSAAALLTLAGASGVAQAQPSSLYAPSAVVLTVAKGGVEGEATVVRAATLSCAPTPRGTHPDPQAACAELAAAAGDFGTLLASPDPDRVCPMHYDPVTVTVDGVWQGSRVSWKHTFSNACLMSATLNGTSLFAF